MNFGYSSQQVGDVNALWEGNVFDIPGFERPRLFERKKAINIQNQQSLLQGYKPYWQEAVETMDASLVSDELIHLVPMYRKEKLILESSRRPWPPGHPRRRRGGERRGIYAGACRSPSRVERARARARTHTHR